MLFPGARSLSVCLSFATNFVCPWTSSPPLSEAVSSGRGMEVPRHLNIPFLHRSSTHSLISFIDALKLLQSAFCGIWHEMKSKVQSRVGETNMNHMTRHVDTGTKERSGSRSGSPEKVAISSPLGSLFQKKDLEGLRKEKEKRCPGTHLCWVQALCRIVSLFYDSHLVFCKSALQILPLESCLSRAS